MTYVKKLVMKGFKSFARETEIVFDQHMNVIVGPNGSGKSNITDALCFVLGRLSIKSIRAAKAAHLIFSGNENYKGGTQAYVELILDNAEKAFSLDNKEISIKRIFNPRPAKARSRVAPVRPPPTIKRSSSVLRTHQGLNLF